jgi:hypothetical protein
MKRTLTALIAVGTIVGAGVVASPRLASAAPDHRSGVATFKDPLSTSLAAACGVDVVGIVNGRYVDREVVTDHGTVERELDVKGFSETVTAPDTGVSFTVPVSTSYHFRYPNGTYPGDPASVSLWGLRRDIMGLPAEVGAPVVLRGTVVTTNSSGFPVVDFMNATLNGTRIVPTLSTKSLCTALAGSCAVPTNGGKWRVHPDGWCPIEPC